MATWTISGEYMETCNCTFLCPCIASNLQAKPTEGDCKAAVAMRIDKGDKDGVKLDGLSFIVTLHSPGIMGEGNITVGKIAGVERRPIRFELDGLKRAVTAGDLIDQACEGVPSISVPGEALGIDNCAHPVATRLSLAKATRSIFKVFGMDWKDTSGTRNGHFSPFAWTA